MTAPGTRVLALRTLLEYERRDAYLGVLLASRLEGSGLDRRDRSLVTELVQGTLRMKLSLDWILKEFSNRPLVKLESGVLWALRLAAYQVMYTSIPDYAAVDMAAGSTASVVGRHAVGFVNAVLRSLARGWERVPFPDRDSDPAGYLEARHSHPRWIARMWIEELGFEKAEAVCAADNADPRLSLRTNLPKVRREHLAEKLGSRGIEVEEGSMTPECLLVKGTGSLSEMTEFRSGLFSVQDQGAQLVGRLLAPAPAMRVLDVCAAPGGKANHLAELMRNEGSVLALDLNPGRLDMVRQSALRLGNGIVETLAIDATGARAGVKGVFDRVLVDAPCSGLGTLSRKPDARWRRQPEDIDNLSGLQRELLSQAAAMVRRGGTLMYSTCTISRRENEDVIASFLESQAQAFEPAPLLAPGRESLCRLQLFPDEAKCDGTFMALMRRKT